jgi:hypothetical protein
MLAACGRRDAEGGFAPLHALLQRVRHDYQMIDVCFHGVTIPPAYLFAATAWPTARAAL